MIKKIAFAVVFSLLFSPLSAFCYQKTMTLTDREIIERLTRLEEGQKAIKEEMNRRFDEMNKRFEERFEAIDKRFDEMNKRFEDRFEEMNRRFEERFDEMNRRFEQRFDEMDKRITDLVHTANTMMVVFGGLVVAMMGLVFWDRRTLIEKAKDVTVRHIETDSRLIKVLRELSKTDKRLAEVMKTFGLF